VRRFAGATFEAQAQYFCFLLYRCVQLHCRKQVSTDDALEIIKSWVASCLSEAPIVDFDSPVLSPRMCLFPAATTPSTQDTTPSTQDSSSTFHSDVSLTSFWSDDLEVSGSDVLDGFCPMDSDIDEDM
jgi:hypothetical protein